MQITFGRHVPPVFEGYTIDQAQACDLDDAFRVLPLAADRYRVQVALSHAAAYVTKDGDLDRAARAAGSSRYCNSCLLAGMLPQPLVQSMMSLRPARQRRILLCTLDLNVAGAAPAVTAVDLGQGVMRNVACLDHDRAAGYLRGTTGGFLGWELRQAGALCDRLLAARREQGALALFFAPAGLWLDEEGHARQAARRTAAPAHLLVQELMILTNRTLAAALSQLAVPMLYRNQSARLPLAPRLRDAVTAMTEDAVRQLCELLTLSTHPARYDARAMGHVGLNVPAYGHFTSPIRRYADLINTRILTAILNGDAPPYTVAELALLAQELNGHSAAAQ